MKLKRTYSVQDLQRRNFKVFDFRNEFRDSFGLPERNGAWLIWGGSGHGKTDFALQLSKYAGGGSSEKFYDCC